MTRAERERQAEFAYQERQARMSNLALGICEECGGDLEPRTRNLDSILGPYQSCICNKGVTGLASIPPEAPNCGGGQSPPAPSPQQPTNNGDVTMPEPQLPITESAARTMFSALDTPLGQLVTRYDDLKSKPLTRMTVEAAKELDTDAKAYLAQAEASDARKAVDNAFKLHRYLSGLFKKATDPANDIRRFCSGVLSRWEQERRRKADEERRQREEAARKEQETQRLEEAAHLEKQGHVEEAKAHLEAPLPPVALPDEKAPAGKVQGVSTVEVYKFRELLTPKVVVAWLVQHPEEIVALFDVKPGELKRRMTAAKGLWDFPAVFTKEIETRNISRG